MTKQNLSIDSFPALFRTSQTFSKEKRNGHHYLRDNWISPCNFNLGLARKIIYHRQSTFELALHKKIEIEEQCRVIDVDLSKVCTYRGLDTID